MECHEVCSIFPEMTREELSSLAFDVARHGLREPIWTFGGKIIDGRSRAHVCRELGILPATREWDGNGSLVAFVTSLNLHRRHLSAGQRAACAKVAKERIAEEIADQERRRKRTWKQVAESSDAVKLGCPDKTGEMIEAVHHGLEEMAESGITFGADEIVSPAPARTMRDAAGEAAALFGTNRRYVNLAVKLSEKAPELFEKVKSGLLTLPQALRMAGIVTKSKSQEKSKTAAKSDPKPNGRRHEPVVRDDRSDDQVVTEWIDREGKTAEGQEFLASSDIDYADYSRVARWIVDRFGLTDFAATIRNRKR